MMSVQKIVLSLCLLGISTVVNAQDSLTTTTLRTKIHHFSIVDGKMVGEGVDLLKKAIAKAQFTLVGDYPDSKSSSDFTNAILPILDDAQYKTMALGVGVPTARWLHTLAQEPTTVVSELRAANSIYALTENKKTILPLPDMKSVEDARFIQKAGALQWSIIGFGSESWNNLPWLLDQMYAALSDTKQQEYHSRHAKCKAILSKMYTTRKGDLLRFATSLKNSAPIQDFLGKMAVELDDSALLEAFHSSIEICRMHAQKLYFEKNQLRVREEKRLLRQELDLSGFDIDHDRLFVKWDLNFLSRGFQPYAFYGLGNTLSEIAEYNGNTSLHIGMIPRYQFKNGHLLDLTTQKNTMSHRLSTLLQAGKKDIWTVIDLRQMIQESQYAPVKYLLNEPLLDLIKRYDLIVIPALEQEATLNHNN